MTIIQARFYKKRQLGQRIAVAVVGFGIRVFVFVAFGTDCRVLLQIDRAPAPAAISAASIQVIDGDTVSAGGAVYRLVGFDAPESGTNASCVHEELLARRATQRLRQLILDGDVQL